MNASIVAGVDAAPVLEAGEEILDFVALPVKDGVVGGLDFVLDVRRDAWGDAAYGKSIAEGD